MFICCHRLGFCLYLCPRYTDGVKWLERLLKIERDPNAVGPNEKNECPVVSLLREDVVQKRPRYLFSTR
uniref:Uncharacterized protein n=1 Tax=Arion vulgaris TaxID=1028688 RepID=A0A0B7ACF9_9EUPU